MYGRLRLEGVVEVKAGDGELHDRRDVPAYGRVFGLVFRHDRRDAPVYGRV